MKLSGEKSENCFKAVVACISFLLFLLLCFVPLGADDLWFLVDAKGVAPGWERFLIACDNMSSRIITDPARLSNLLTTIFLGLLPKAVFNLLSGVALYVLINQSCVLARVKRGSAFSYYLLAVIMFAFPWYDYMLFVAFMLNYIWAGAMIVTAANILVGNVRLKSVAAECLLCFLAGWMHEGFAIPLCFAVTIYMLVAKRFGDKRSLKQWLSLGVGSIVIFLFPSVWRRASEAESVLTKFPLKEGIMQLGPALLIFIIFAVISLIYIMKRARDRKMLTFFAAYAIAALAVFIKFYCGPRTGTPLILMSGIGAVYALQTLLPHGRRLTAVLATVISCGIAINMVAACCLQSQLKKENDDIVRLYEESPSGTITYDITYPRPDATLFKTTVRAFHDKMPRHQFSMFYGSADRELVILPSSMAGFSEQRAAKSKYSDALIYNGNIILPADRNVENNSITVITAAGDEIESRYRCDQFTDDAGKRHNIIVPHCKTLDSSLTIVDAKL